MAPGPFEQALGESFERLPAVVQASHRGGEVFRLTGTAKVEGAAGFARIVAALFGLPGSQDRAGVIVTKTRVGAGQEIWKRQIGKARFRSRIVFAGPNRVEESFGLFTVGLELSADEHCLTMKIDGWRIGPVPLPGFLAPRSVATESVSAAGLFAFDVPISAPLLGRLVHYRGELRPQSKERAP